MGSLYKILKKEEEKGCDMLLCTLWIYLLESTRIICEVQDTTIWACMFQINK